MESHHANDHEASGPGKNQTQNQSSGTGFNNLCSRQSSSRWTPTTDQIRILKELYYNNGVRSPTAEQIQRISAKLRQYGKIEGKNVFYWFQNHKARERQKKRFTAANAPVLDYHHHHHHILSSNIHTRPAPPPPNGSSWKNEPDVCPNIHIKFTNAAPPPAGNFSSSSSACSTGFLNVGSVGNYGYGSMAMEKRFRECTINPTATGGNASTGTSSSVGHHNYGWIGVNHDPNLNSPLYQYPFLDKRRAHFNYNGDQTLVGEYLDMEEQEDQNQEDEEEETSHEIETLPLFPMHGGDSLKKHKETEIQYYFNGGWLNSEDHLELTLNSYALPTFPN